MNFKKSIKSGSKIPKNAGFKSKVKSETNYENIMDSGNSTANSSTNSAAKSEKSAKSENRKSDNRKPENSAPKSEPRQHPLFRNIKPDTYNQNFSSHDLNIHEIPVKFPFATPYPAQRAMMWRIVAAIKSGTHCLVESPTGSGKTISYICAAASWHQANSKRIIEENEQVAKRLHDLNFKLEQKKMTEIQYNMDLQKLESSGDVQFKSTGRIWIGTRTHQQVGQIIKELQNSPYRWIKTSFLGAKDRMCVNPKALDSKNGVREACNDLMKNRRCAHFNNQDKINNHNDLAAAGLKNPVFDMEELADWGRLASCCPYYLTRKLVLGNPRKGTAASAKIIICPYQYLIDPAVREGFNIKNDVIILDEAHNIENQCREAASLRIDKTGLDASIENLENNINFYEEMRVRYPDTEGYVTTLKRLNSITQLVRGIGLFIVEKWKTKKGLIKDNFRKTQTFQKFGNKPSLLVLLKELGMEKDVRFQGYKQDFASLYEGKDDEIGENEQENETGEKVKVKMLPSQGTKQLLQQVFYVVDNVHKSCQKGEETDDFRGNLVFETENEFEKDGKFGGGGKKGTGFWNNKNKGGSTSKTVTKLNKSRVMDNFLIEEYTSFSLDIMCMNPALQFKHLREKARSVILCSGTLTPTESFACELETTFAVQCCPHVINTDQVFTRVIGTSNDSRRELLCNYQNMKDDTFKEEIIDIIAEIADRTSNGMLVFFSSYQNLRSFKFLMKKKKDLLRRFSKIMYWEDEAPSKDLDKWVGKYFKSAETDFPGAIMFGVFRGKLSEGFDFADKKARAVVTVGIPFPAFSSEVQMKMKNNDDKKKTNKDFLSGDSWYFIEALRAINQALGRCIRHRYDWGAMFLIDNRFNSEKYRNGLSKWIKKTIDREQGVSQILESYNQFTDDKAINPPKPAAPKPSKPTDNTTEMKKLAVNEVKGENDETSTAEPTPTTSVNQLLSKLQHSPKMEQTKRTLGGKRKSAKSKFFETDTVKIENHLGQSSSQNSTSSQLLQIPVGRNLKALPKRVFVKPSESESEFEIENTPPVSFRKSQPSKNINQNQPEINPENNIEHPEKLEKQSINNEKSSEIVILGSSKKIEDTDEQDLLNLSSLSDWKSTQGKKSSQKENEDQDLSGIESFCNLDESVVESEDSVVIMGGTTPPSKKLKIHN